MRCAVVIAAVLVASVSWGCESTQETGRDVAAIERDTGVAAIERGTGEHGLFTPQQVQWEAGPASLPEGSEMAVLEGDPTEEGIFAMRLRLPDGYVIPPHTHPAVERVTVIEGTFHLGMSESFDPQMMQALPAGSYFYMPPGMVHFAQAEGETIVQLNGVGPWDIVYVDPADDPRR